MPGRPDAVAVSSGTGALHLGVRALGWGAGDEVVTTPFSFVASANCLLFEDVKPVFCDVDPVTLNLDPAAAGGSGRRAHRGHPPGRHPRLPGGDPGVREARGRPRAWARSRTPARRSARSTPIGRGLGAARDHGGVRLLPQQAIDDGGGGHADPRRRADRGPRPQRAKPGPQPRTWSSSTTSGSASTTASATSRRRSASAQLERVDELLAARARVAGLRRAPGRARRARAGRGPRWACHAVRRPR